jgi:superfamily II DNA or RNA helicase
MISKLCAFNGRSEFILTVLAKELQIKPEQQIMVLAHNKCLLEYLHDAIKHRQMATVGYYVGGMKEADLKKSEICQIIIATYAMASEALDIKTLTTLVLATPKTDIVQAVGRILRVKHERPLVVDIVDSHEVFLSQWQKRRKYYLANNYTVMHTKSHLYVLDQWNDTGTKVIEKPKVNKTTKICDKNTKVSAANTKICDKNTKVSAANLMAKGAAAAALFVNSNYQPVMHSEYMHSEYMQSEYMHSESMHNDEHSMLKGRCYI